MGFLCFFCLLAFLLYRYSLIIGGVLGGSLLFVSEEDFSKFWVESCNFGFLNSKTLPFCRFLSL